MEAGETIDIVECLNEIVDIAHCMVQPLESTVVAGSICDRRVASQVMTLRIHQKLSSGAWVS